MSAAAVLPAISFSQPPETMATTATTTATTNQMTSASTFTDIPSLTAPAHNNGSLRSSVTVNALSAGTSIMPDHPLEGEELEANLVDAGVTNNGAPQAQPQPAVAPAVNRFGLGRRNKTRISLFEIGLDDNRTIFLPGQRLEGHVCLNVTEPITVRILRVRFSGTVSTRLSRKEHSLSSGSSTTVLFKELQTMLGSPGEDERVRLEPGEYVYPFSFRVPLTSLPASFEGNFGRVKYEITAILARPTSGLKTCHAVVTIPSTVDSADAEYQEPVESKALIPVGFWLWRTGHMNVSLSIPKGAYSSEEVVPVTLDLVNHSGSGAVLKDVYMKQAAIYKTGTEVRGPNTERIHRLTFTEHFPAQTRHIRRIINFPIPATSIFSPTIKTAALEVKHSIIVKVSADHRFAKVQKLEIPITIAGFPSMLPDFGPNGARISIDTLPVYTPPPQQHARETSRRMSFGRSLTVSTTHSRLNSGMVVAVVPLQTDDNEDFSYPTNRFDPASPTLSGRSFSYSSRRRHASEPQSNIYVEESPMRSRRSASRRRSRSGVRSLGRIVIPDATRGDSTPDTRLPLQPVVDTPTALAPSNNPLEQIPQAPVDTVAVSGRSSTTLPQSLPRRTFPSHLTEKMSTESPVSDNVSISISPPTSPDHTTTSFASSSSTIAVSSMGLLGALDPKLSPLRNKDSAVALDTLKSVADDEAEV
ncbi:Arrestin domain-containing protein 4 [Phlyctochytrium planicorne]|nr:Arrestin domain-containing protein 4 [Phlyctochytrium planicorne]